MDRNHRVFTFFISHEVQGLVPDPEGSGELRHTGEKFRTVRTLTVIATSQAIADAWIRENPYRFPGLIVKSCIETKIDGIIETHTY